MIFTIFLPPLIYEAAIHIKWQELRRADGAATVAFSIALAFAIGGNITILRTLQTLGFTVAGVASLVPGVWALRNALSSLLSRVLLVGLISYLFLSPIVNTASMPSIALRIVWGFATLFIALKPHDKVNLT